MKNRFLKSRLHIASATRSGRILVLTGARQTGKTTLIRKLFPDYAYIPIEDPVLRPRLGSLTSGQWRDLYPFAILDEVQKAPVLIETVKAVYDQWSEPKYVLLGSSQLLLLEKVKESLAGRCHILELYPLTLPELRTSGWEQDVEMSFFQKLLTSTENLISPASFYLDDHMASKANALENYLMFGGYPAVSDGQMPHSEKNIWLNNFIRTYLERDVRDLASFRDLEPFVRLQQYISANTGMLFNASEVAKRMGMAAKTVIRYLRYLEISYQAVILSAWAGNPGKRLAKAPKIHLADPGIQRAIVGNSGTVGSHVFEGAIIGEIYKQVKNLGLPARFFHLRTHDGKEVDFLIELPDGYFAIEIKSTDRVRPGDAKHLGNLSEILDKPLLGAFVLSNDPDTKTFPHGTQAMHVALFLG